MNSPVIDKPNQSIKENTSSENSIVEHSEVASEIVTELCEDMEMIGPGQMLAEARKQAGLTQDDIANRLNFRALLVNNIENEIFDNSLPATFNRGYLRNYAKLVGIDVEDVLASYDALGAAHIQRTEMQSFSNLTEKQAQHSRLMWVSYLIVAILIGSTVVWWLQDARQQKEPQSVVPVSSNSQVSALPATPNSDKTANVGLTQKTQPQAENSAAELAINEPVINESAINKQSIVNAGINESISEGVNEVSAKSAVKDVSEITAGLAADVSEHVNTDPQVLASQQSTEKPVLSTAVFTFSGDCWVNIYDDTGERIAWGVKKSGYVMTVSGKAPLRITLGKPELASIVFNNEAVDMSAFNAGNIAKFTLPLSL